MWWYLIIYVVGIVVSLYSIHKWKDSLKVNDYDSEENMYGDWESNAEAFMAFSIAWPLFWGFQLLIYLYNLLLKLSIIIEKEISKQDKKI
jgi:hypothetical protein